MNASASENLITNGLTTFGSSVLVIVGAVLVVGIAYLVFKFGWYKIKNALFDDNVYYNVDGIDYVANDWGDVADHLRSSNWKNVTFR